jgi:signal transduction histidine kinase
MTPRSWNVLDWTARLLVAGVATSIMATSWLGYRAVHGWRESASLLAEQRAADWADRLAAVLGRDMHGVQATVLASAQWNQFMLDPPYDVRILAASAFARYPYPESFFAWRGTPTPETVVFLDRSDRRPPWMPGPQGLDPFPVVVEYEPSVARMLLVRIERDAMEGRRFSIFEMNVAGARYQVVACLLYRDALRERAEGAFGFTVNLGWVREHYFPDVARQVARMGGSGSTMPLSVLDGRGRQVAGPADRVLPEPVRRREFPLAFFDPQLITPHPGDDLPHEMWVAAAAGGGDPVLGDAIRGGNRTLVLAAVAAGVFALGLIMTARATRTRARLAHLRSEFVAAVTHELKTPIAAIRAAGDTMARGRVSTPEALRDYVQLVVQESKRLARLVDNLLAYSRITDVTEAYEFTALDLSSLVREVLAGFRTLLDSAGFAVHVDVPPSVPPAYGDRTAILLLLDNLIDNAIRYSPTERWLQIRAGTDPSGVTLEVSDHGMGITHAELPHVTRKFFRGRRSASGGSGLGLAIATRIVRDHGGTIRIESEVGAGTIVRVTLRVAGSRNEETNSDR